MHLYKRGRWWWIYLGLTPQGKQIRRSLKVTDKRTANLLLADYQLKAVRKELRIPGEPIPLNQIFTEYLRYGDLHKKRSTIKTDRNRLKRFKTFCESKDIESVQEIDHRFLRSFIDQVLKTSSKATANRYIDQIRAMLKFAAREHEFPLDERIRQMKKFPEDRAKVVQVFTDRELKQIFSIPDWDFANLLKIMYYGLLRREEARMLTWKDIDLKKGYITIQSKPGFSPKSKKLRTIPMHPQIALTLRQMPQDGRYIFDSGNGCPKFGSEYITQRFRKIAKSLGIKKRLHDLRHTAATRLLESGASLKAVQEFLGHSTPELTLRIYSHITPGYQKKAIKFLA